MHLRGARACSAYPFLELELRRVEPADDHQRAAEDLVGLGVLDVELERLGQGPDRFADLLLREVRVAERVPAPGGRGPLLDVRREQGLDLRVPAPRGCSASSSATCAGSSRRRARRSRRGAARAVGAVPRAGAPAPSRTRGAAVALLLRTVRARSGPRSRGGAGAHGAASRPRPRGRPSRAPRAPSATSRVAVLSRSSAVTSSRPFCSSEVASSLRPARASARPS